MNIINKSNHQVMLSDAPSGPNDPAMKVLLQFISEMMGKSFGNPYSWWLKQPGLPQIFFHQPSEFAQPASVTSPNTKLVGLSRHVTIIFAGFRRISAGPCRGLGSCGAWTTGGVEPVLLALATASRSPALWLAAGQPAQSESRPYQLL